MSKNVAMFVDVANMYYAARGQDVDVDYVALLKHASKGRDLIRAYAYTGLDPENENQRKFIDFLAKNGYKPVIKDIRKFGDGRMKANLDIELVVDLFRLADRMDIAVIVSGDGDFAPAIRALQDKGVRAEVISFKPNTSSDLIAVADEFTDIMKIASISRKEARATLRSMSAPEMPAKEVTPEFGFREASPSVAAAALAALKSGGTAVAGGNGRRTRGGAGRRGATASEETPAERPSAAAPASPAALESAAETEEGRRRRRRRGGRGRGRGRRDEGAGLEGEAVTTGADEIGWEELDDLSQVDGLDADREYGFEEADAATLAELGIDPAELAPSVADAAPSDVAEPADEPKPRRRSTRSASGAGADAEGTDKPKRARRSTKASDEAASDDATADKPRRTRRSTKETGDAPADDASAEKPKRARRSSSKAGGESPAADEAVASDPGTDESGEPQGIWGRFRSARKPRTAGGS